MEKFYVTVVSKEYRTIAIEAETAEDAKDEAWNRLSDGLDELGHVGEIDVDTEIYVEAINDTQ